MSMPQSGKPAPDFSLPSSQGTKIRLKDFVGKSAVALYFYPKDDTPGCTVEACEFRDNFKAIEQAGAVILGISPDPLTRHESFIEKHGLPFVLLSDEDHAVCQKFGVWVEKSMYGKKYWGVVRTTFLIDRKGVLRQTFEKVKPEGHAREILNAIKALNRLSSSSKIL